MILLIILFQCILTETITEFTSFTNKDPLNWYDSSNQPFQSTIICQQQFITPFLGPINNNIHKLYTDLKPHYALAISMDILYFGYWNNNSNYFRVQLDSQTIIFLEKIKSSSFSIPLNYCQNAVITAFKEIGYSTYIAKIQHSELTILLELQSTYNCKPQGCEQYAMKNLILDIYECHQSCLTCSGPEYNNCLTCPSSESPNSGVCSCNPIVSYNNACVANCPNFFYNKDGLCLQDCSAFCTQCTEHKCTQCQSNYLIQDGECVQKCSFNKYQNQNQCIDIKEQALFNSDYLGKYFYSESHFYEESEIFQFVPSTNGNLKTYSFLTQQKFSYFQNQFMLGGWSVFSTGEMQLSYNDLPQHSQLRIKFRAIFIDNWNGENIIATLDGQTIYKKSITTTANFIQLDQPDYTEEIDVTIPHIQNTALFSITSELSIPSYEASLGITDIAVLYDLCNDQLLEYKCNKCKTTYTLLKGYCVVDLTQYYRNSDKTCIPGYYDIEQQLKCEKCNIKCKSCQSSDTCKECQPPYDGLPACLNCIDGYQLINGSCLECVDKQNCFQCQVGFYLDENNQCQPCQSHCQQCTITECLQCEPYYYNVNNKCQVCGTGYLISNSKCLQCHQKCLVCEGQQDNCLYCNSARENPPNCNCEFGYFENDSFQCQTCSQQCSSCESSSANCLTCSANRVSPPKCSCPPETIREIDQICTTCKIAYINAKFNDQLDSIVINFNNPLNPLVQLCKLIFQPYIVNLLGENPICNINENYLTISLGNNAQINVFQQFLFQPNSLQFEGCNEFIQTYDNNLLLFPQNYLTPNLFLNFQEIYYYQNSQVIIVQQLVNGKRNLSLIDWIVKPNQDISITSEIDVVLQQLNEQLITFKFHLKQIQLQFEGKITYQLRYKNFIGQSGLTDLTINFKKSQPQLLINICTSLEQQFYINDSYDLIFQPYFYDFITQTNVNEVQTIKFNLILSLNNIVIEEFHSLGETNSYFKFHLDTTNFTSSDFYFLQLQITDINNNILNTVQRQISIQNQVPLLKIIGGNRELSYNTVNQIKAVLYNTTQSNFTYQWTCINVSDNSICKSLDSSNLKLDQTNLTLYDDSSQALVILQIPAHTFNAYQTVQLVLSIHFNDYVIQDSIIIIVEEDAIPQIDIISHNFKQKYNYYDQLYFRFKYDVTNINTDLLTFIGTIYQDHQILHQQKYLYLEITLSLWEFILDNPESLIFKFTVFNPNYIKTSSINIKLLLNKPPTNCQIQLNAQTGRSLQDDIEVKIKNCIDDDQPLMYRYVIYKSKQDYQTDQTDSIVKKGRIISHYSYSSSLSFQLPGIDETYLLIMVQDTNFGITNLTQIFTNTAPNIDHNQRYSSYLSDLNQSNLLMKTHLILLDMEEFNYYDSTTLTTLKNELNDMQSTDITRTQLQEIHYLINQIQVKSNTTLTATELNSQLRQITYSCELISANMSKVFSNQAKNSIQSQNKQDKEELYQQFEILNNLIKLNNQVSAKQYRMLEDSLSNKELIFNSIYSINNSTLIQQVINGPNSIMNGSEIQIINAKLSALQAKQQMNLSNVNESISFSQQYYQDNPYAQDQDFQEFKEQYQSNGYPLYAAQTSNLNTTSASLSSYSINYTFDLHKSIQELDLQCASLYNKTWTTKICETKKQQNNTILCICSNLSPTTILEAAQIISRDILSLFTLDALQSIEQHNYLNDIYIYIIMVETIFYVWGLFQAKRLDKRMNLNNENISRIYPQRLHNTQYSDIRTDRQLKTDRIEKVTEMDVEDKQFSFKRQSHHLYQSKIHKIQVDSSSNHQIEEAKEKKLSITLQSERAILGKLHIQEGQSSSPEIASHRSGDQRTQYENGWKKSFLSYIKLFHKVIGLYYRYDQKLSRIIRLTLLYASFIGQIAFHACFGQIFNLNTLLALSILSFIFGNAYKRIVTVGLSSENKIIYNLTLNFAILSFLTFYYIILASIALNKTEFAQIIWPFVYLANLFLDLCVYSLLIHLSILCIFKKYKNNLYLKKLAKLLFQQQEFEFLCCEQEQGNLQTQFDTKSVI